MSARKPQVILLRWKDSEIHGLAARLKNCTVTNYVPVPGEGMNGLQKYGLPDALVISLDRLPSHGRDIGYAFHKQKATRQVPLVYVGGDEDKIAKIRDLLPEASFTGWDRILATIHEAISNPAVTPPKPVRVVISEAPLHQKIGLKADMHIALMNAPAPLEKLVPGLPQGIRIYEQPAADEVAMTLWFVRSTDEFECDLPAIAAALGKKPRLWSFYQKGSKKGFSWNGLLESAAIHRLSQFKIMRLNDVWTGVAFGRSRG